MGHTVDTLIGAIEGTDTLSMGAICDFGIDSGVAFGRTNWDIFTQYRLAYTSKQITRDELFVAACSGPKLTELLRRHSPNITIQTVYDNMVTNDKEEDKG